MPTSSNEPGEGSAGKIQADEIMATNVANVQYIQTQQITLQGEQRLQRSPLQRPLRAEHFVNREAERTRLLADLKAGRVVTVCGLLYKRTERSRYSATLQEEQTSP